MSRRMLVVKLVLIVGCLAFSIEMMVTGRDLFFGLVSMIVLVDILVDVVEQLERSRR